MDQKPQHSFDEFNIEFGYCGRFFVSSEKLSPICGRQYSAFGLCIANPRRASVCSGQMAQLERCVNSVRLPIQIHALLIGQVSFVIGYIKKKIFSCYKPIIKSFWAQIISLTKARAK